MLERALVLGGGGPVGIAWQAGVLAGLAMEGVALGAADMVLGTSAGSFVGAQIASGRDPIDFANAQMKLGQAEAQTQSAPAPTLDPGPFGALVAKMPTDHELSQAMRREFGVLAKAAATPSLEAYLKSFAAFAKAGRAWPAKFACTAVDVDSGEFKVFRESDEAPLNLAIAASCSVPGIFPPVEIGARLWMDGGVRSSTSMDVASGHTRVLTLAVITPLTGALVRNSLAREEAALQAAGGATLVLAPDANSLAVFGPNLMNPANRAKIVAAGLQQGKQDSARVRALWGQ